MAVLEAGDAAAPGEAREAPRAGEIFRQPDLAATLRKLVEAEKQALAAGKSRKDAIQAAYDRFYKGDIAQEFVRGVQEQGGLITLDDLAKWRPLVEEPLHTNYRGVEVYKLDTWTQGPALLQSLNILENFDLRAMGYNSANYIHTVYQAMNLAFADRDFYYGDPLLPAGRADARTAVEGIREGPRRDDPSRPQRPARGPGRSVSVPGRARIRTATCSRSSAGRAQARQPATELTAQQFERVRRRLPHRHDQRRVRGRRGLARVGDTERRLDSRPRSPAAPASASAQRMQSFVLDPAQNPFNVLEPGKRPRVTLTPSMAFRDGKPWLAFAVQGGDTQDQNLLQFFLNVLEFGMTPQEASEAANFNSFQMRVVVRQARITAGPHRAERPGAAVGAQGTRAARLQARVRIADLGADQRDHARPRARHDLGRVEQPRRGLRRRLVILQCTIAQHGAHRHSLDSVEDCCDLALFIPGRCNHEQVVVARGLHRNVQLRARLSL